MSSFRGQLELDSSRAEMTYMSTFPTRSTETRPALVLAIPAEDLTAPHAILVLSLALQHLHTGEGLHGRSSASRNRLQGKDLSPLLRLMRRRRERRGRRRGGGAGEGDRRVAVVRLTAGVGGVQRLSRRRTSGGLSSSRSGGLRDPSSRRDRSRSRYQLTRGGSAVRRGGG